MRRLAAIILVLILQNSLHAQGILSITKKYFRYDPFKSSFGFFVKHLKEDPALKEKSIVKATDTTYYFFEGIYKNHSPFSFTSQKTKVILAQQLHPGDTSAYENSIIVYQLVGYAIPGEAGQKQVQEEYKKFYRRYKFKFQTFKERTFENKEKNSGEITDFRYGGLPFSPASAAWSSNKDKSENLFVVTIRFIVVENRAFLPVLNVE